MTDLSGLHSSFLTTTHTVYLVGYGLDFKPASEPIRFDNVSIDVFGKAKEPMELVCSSNGKGSMYRYKVLAETPKYGGSYYVDGPVELHQYP